ncbi:YlbF family regulator [Vagococcus xieshaowenii]|uniref:YlbF family regulator n=1 Tax=Vagococcus xieshaowenii TaxID=2562451 RepID=A0AAJ5EH30_9ENTE|nr:YlbF family regulator [Vagococcus xieshaowenii]QCA28375.1 YlbF family regulator [Vagococcus xieshaowenii]TFZ42868.1 YlbF family regulator [Vagococcus xieshaowenii]
MIYTEETIRVEEKTRTLITTITQSETLNELVTRRTVIEQSNEINKKVKQFIEAKEAFEKVEAYGKFAPDYTEKRRHMRKMKRELDTNEAVMDYRISESDLQETLDLISYQLAQIVSPDIKIDAGNPFFEFAQRGCGGSCHVG